MFQEKSNSFTNFTGYISNGDFSSAYLSCLVNKFTGSVKNFSFHLGPNVFYNIKSVNCYMECHKFCVFKTCGQNNQLPTLRKQTSHFHNRESFAVERYRANNSLAKPQN